MTILFAIRVATFLHRCLSAPCPRTQPRNGRRAPKTLRFPRLSCQGALVFVVVVVIFAVVVLIFAFSLAVLIVINLISAKNYRIDADDCDSRQ